MRHEANDIPLHVADSRNVAARSVGVCFPDHAALRIGVAKHDLAIPLQRVECGVVGVIVSFTVRNREFEDITFTEL